MTAPNKDKPYHYTYEITNIYNGMRYIGAHSSKKPPHLDTKYMGSSKTLKKAIKEEGLDHFDNLILAVFPTREKALAYEVFLHLRFNVDKDETFYNKARQKTTGFDFSGPKTEEAKRAVGDRTRKKVQPIETRTALSLALSGENNALYGKPLSQEHRNKISESLKNRTRYLYVTPVGEFANARGAGRALQCRGSTIIKRCEKEFEGYSLKPVTENKKEEFKTLYENGVPNYEIEKILDIPNYLVNNWRKDLDLGKRKRRYSLETRKNQSRFRTGEGNPLYGRPMPQENKEKISEGWSKHVNSIFITPAGEFNTAVDAGKALQCSSSTITRRCKEGTEGYSMKPARDKKSEFKELYEKGLKLTEIAVILEIHKNTAGAWKRGLNLSSPPTIDSSWQKNYCC